MKKITPFLAVLLFISCKSHTNTRLTAPVTNPSQAVVDFPETTTTFDYEVKEFKTGEKMTLVNQDLPQAPECFLKPGDTLRLCKSYGEKEWHVEGYYKGWAEVDHCETMTSAILLSIKKINCRIFKPNM